MGERKSRHRLVALAPVTGFPVGGCPFRWRGVCLVGVRPAVLVQRNIWALARDSSIWMRGRRRRSRRMPAPGGLRGFCTVLMNLSCIAFETRCRSLPPACCAGFRSSSAQRRCRRPEGAAKRSSPSNSVLAVTGLAVVVALERGAVARSRRRSALRRSACSGAGMRPSLSPSGSVRAQGRRTRTKRAPRR